MIHKMVKFLVVRIVFTLGIFIAFAWFLKLASDSLPPLMPFLIFLLVAFITLRFLFARKRTF